MNVAGIHFGGNHKIGGLVGQKTPESGKKVSYTEWSEQRVRGFLLKTKKKRHRR